MILTHPDYFKLVMSTYNEKLAKGELPLLAHSTPGNIRKACINMYRAGCERKDEPTLNAFFGQGEHGEELWQLIENSGADRFRPLNNFLKGGTETPGKINIDLLAWLIGFRHRPYRLGMDVLLNEWEVSALKDIGQPPAETKSVKEEAPVTERDGDDKTKEEKDTITKEENLAHLVVDKIDPGLYKGRLINDDNGNGKSKKPALILLLVLIGAVGIYGIWQQKQGNFLGMFFGNSNTICVYWAGDHYEPIGCNEEPKGKLILAMDPEKVADFRMITTPDTITEYSIRKVYYIKDSNKIKYYTTAGNYPEDITRSLKPLSKYMFNKYLNKNAITAADSFKR